MLTVCSMAKLTHTALGFANPVVQLLNHAERNTMIETRRTYLPISYAVRVMVQLTTYITAVAHAPAEVLWSS